ncbi:unnamed protein product [Cuscuta epithymum]|uniref:Uncharacterized protein n=1 Tax=Cuscuta epithymum TaxID=186058 RepID=A0AAV0E2G8_9ASTE|nr:unnamed protein product [Cuscuta epithymum]
MEHRIYTKESFSSIGGHNHRRSAADYCRNDPLCESSPGWSPMGDGMVRTPDPDRLLLLSSLFEAVSEILLCPKYQQRRRSDIRHFGLFFSPPPIPSLPCQSSVAFSCCFTFHFRFVLFYLQVHLMN